MSKRQKKSHFLRNFILLFSLCVLAYLVAYLISGAGVVKSLTIEAGEKVSASSFYKEGDADARFSLTCPPFYPAKPGNYTVEVQKGFFKHRASLTVVDTTDPVGHVQDMTLVYGLSVTPEDFVTDVSDATDVSLSFAVAPDMEQLGTSHVTILLRDEAGNETLLTTNLTVVPVKPSVTIEAGEKELTLEDLVLKGSPDRSTLNLSLINYHHVGSYDTYVTVEGQVYPCHIQVVDTAAPLLEVQDLHATVGIEKTIDDFITLLQDETDVKLSLSSELNFQEIGESALTIAATDEGGNVTAREVMLYVEPDTEPPVIEAKDFTSFENEPITYRSHVAVSDNSGEEVILEIDASKVDNTTVGEYPVVFTATDYAGNVSTKTITVSITERTYTEDDLNERIDILLAGLITPDMTDRQKARVIVDWVKENIAYTGSSDKTNFNRAAIEGLLDYKGDCFTNSAICVAAFKRLGIDALIVKKVPIISMYRHWWLMVEIDGGWYHIDTCPRTWDKPDIFLWTESQLSEYSATHTETHNYDRSLYPEVTP